MLEKKEPLLLLDNSSMYVVGSGDYHSTDLSFEEAKAIIDMYDTPDILRCYTDRAIDDVLCEYIGIQQREFAYKPVRKCASVRTPLPSSGTSLNRKRSRKYRPTTA